MHTYINQWQSANYQPHGSLTPSEVATKMGVKTATVYAWLSRREMQAKRVGSRRFITEQQIKDFLSRRKSGDYVDLTYANGPVH